MSYDELSAIQAGPIKHFLYLKGSRCVNCYETDPCRLPLPEEAEFGSTGKQPNKGYSGRRCAKGASDPRLKNTRARLFSIHLDTGATPPKSESGIFVNGKELRKSTLPPDEPFNWLTKRYDCYFRGETALR